MSISVAEFLKHMVEEARFLAAQSAQLTLSEFMADEVLKRAFVRSIEIIGEAAKRVPAEVRARATDLDWKRMAAMRDRLIQGYFGTDYTIVFEVA